MRKKSLATAKIEGVLRFFKPPYGQNVLSGHIGTVHLTRWGDPPKIEVHFTNNDGCSLALELDYDEVAEFFDERMLHVQERIVF